MKHLIAGGLIAAGLAMVAWAANSALQPSALPYELQRSPAPDALREFPGGFDEVQHLGALGLTKEDRISFPFRRLPLHFEMRRRLRGKEKSSRLKVLGCCTSRRNSGRLNVDAGKLERLELRAAGFKNPIATAIVTQDREGRLVPLSWSNAVTEPVFFSDVAPTEASKVLTAINEHVPSEAIILAWWDSVAADSQPHAAASAA